MIYSRELLKRVPINRFDKYNYRKRIKFLPVQNTIEEIADWLELPLIVDDKVYEKEVY